MEPLTFLICALLLYRNMPGAPAPAWMTFEATNPHLQLDRETRARILAAHAGLCDEFPQVMPWLIGVTVSGGLQSQAAFDWAEDIYRRAELPAAVLRPATATSSAQALQQALQPMSRTTLGSATRTFPRSATARLEPDEQSLELAVSYAYDCWSGLRSKPLRQALSDAMPDALVQRIQPGVEEWLRQHWTASHCTGLEELAQLLSSLASGIRSVTAMVVHEGLVAFGVDAAVADAVGTLAGLLVPVGSLNNVARGLRVVGVGLCAANGHLGRCACRAGLVADVVGLAGGAWLGRQIADRDWTSVVLGAFVAVRRAQGAVSGRGS